MALAERNHYLGEPSGPTRLSDLLAVGYCGIETPALVLRLPEGCHTME